MNATIRPGARTVTNKSDAARDKTAEKGGVGEITVRLRLSVSVCVKSRAK